MNKSSMEKEYRDAAARIRKRQGYVTVKDLAVEFRVAPQAVLRFFQQHPECEMYCAILPQDEVLHVRYVQAAKRARERNGFVTLHDLAHELTVSLSSVRAFLASHPECAKYCDVVTLSEAMRLRAVAR